jgi:uncharacterized protein YodC (DUF2158 family)
MVAAYDGFFARRDVVRLLGGGPEMVVEASYVACGRRYEICSWIDGDEMRADAIYSEKLALIERKAQ